MRRSVSLGLGSVILGSFVFVACGGGGDGGGRPDDEGDQGGGTSGTGTGGTAGSATGGTPNGGTAGTAGSGNGGTAGSSGSGGSGGTNTCKACMPQACGTDTPPTATINDFEQLLIDPLTPTFGIYNAADENGMAIIDPPWWEGYYAGSFAYPGIPEACTGEPTPEYPITRADAEGELSVTGTVGTYSGFGVWLGQCMVDMSAYSGVSFRIGGTTGSGMLKFSVLTNANSTPVMCLTGKGTCDVATAGACTPASMTISVPETPEVVTVEWADLTGGSPEAAVDPSQVLQLQWDFDWMDGMTPYEVNVTVDDVVLVE
jgi:hypothetical protein